MGVGKWKLGMKWRKKAMVKWLKVGEREEEIMAFVKRERKNTQCPGMYNTPSAMLTVEYINMFIV